MEERLKIVLPRSLKERIESVSDELGIPFMDFIGLVREYMLTGFDFSGVEQDFDLYELPQFLSDEMKGLIQKLGVEPEKAMAFFSVGFTPFLRACTMPEAVESFKKVFKAMK